MFILKLGIKGNFHDLIKSLCRRVYKNRLNVEIFSLEIGTKTCIPTIIISINQSPTSYTAARKK